MHKNKQGDFIMNEIEKQNYVKNIREQYEYHDESKIEKLRGLDKKVKMPANIFAYTFGVVGALVLGLGMCMAMKVIFDMMILGIVIGCVGIAMVSVNYFIYKAILNSRKDKYADQILKLADEATNK